MDLEVVGLCRIGRTRRSNQMKGFESLLHSYSTTLLSGLSLLFSPLYTPPGPVSAPLNHGSGRVAPK